MSQIEGFCTAREAAEIIGKSHTQLCKYVRDGLLPAIKVGRSILIAESHARNFVPPPMGNPNFRRAKKS